MDRTKKNQPEHHTLMDVLLESTSLSFPSASERPVWEQIRAPTMVLRRSSREHLWASWNSRFHDAGTHDKMEHRSATQNKSDEINF